MVTIVTAYRLEVVRTKIAEPSPPIHSAKDVARRYGHLAKYDREYLLRLDLDNRSRIIGEETVSIGTASAAMFSPREVFIGALLNPYVRWLSRPWLSPPQVFLRVVLALAHGPGVLARHEDADH